MVNELYVRETLRRADSLSSDIEELYEISRLRPLGEKEKKTALSLVKRKKKVKAKLMKASIRLRNLTGAHKSTVGKLPYLMKERESLERKLVIYNEDILASGGAELTPFLILVAGSKSKYVGGQVPVFSPDLDPSILREGTSFPEYKHTLSTYVDICRQVESVYPSLVGLYATLGANLTDKDVAFLCIHPDLRDLISKIKL